VREHGTWRRIDEQSRRRGEDEVAVCDAPLEEGLARRKVVHVRVEEVARDAGEVHDVALGDRATMRDERLADLELLEVFPEGVHAVETLGGAPAPLVRHGRERLRRAL